MERRGKHPIIQTVVYNVEENEALKSLKCWNNTEYDIDFKGDIKTTYSNGIIINSTLDEEALKKHIQYSQNALSGENFSEEKCKAEFLKYEYYYQSSVAGAIHGRVRDFIGLPVYAGNDEVAYDCTPTDSDYEKRIYCGRVVEKMRWNAYTRSIGYIYESGEKRHHVKLHPCLVPYDALSIEDKIKNH